MKTSSLLTSLSVLLVWAVASGCRTPNPDTVMAKEPVAHGVTVALPVGRGSASLVGPIAVPQYRELGAPMSVLVIGPVERPGVCTLPRGSTVLEAIAACGGMTRAAQPSRIQVVRRSGLAPPVTYLLSLHRQTPLLLRARTLWYGALHSRFDFRLQEGDIVQLFPKP